MPFFSIKYIGYRASVCFLYFLNLVSFEVFAADNIVPLSKHFNTDKQKFAFVVPNLKQIKFKDGSKVGIGARQCGNCHSEIFKEWQDSTHAHAFSDLQFQAEIAKPGQPVWLCLNCHIPVENQREKRVIGLTAGNLLLPVEEKNEYFDAELAKEGITCASCHLKTIANETVVIGPTGDLKNQAPHKVIQNKTALASRCNDCHNVTDKLNDNFTCWFATADELSSGPYGKTGTTCVSCHMPKTLRPAAKGFPPKDVSRHLWVGGGIPKTYEGYDSLLQRGFGNALEPGLRAQVRQGKHDTFIVTLRNLSAGHWIPTGDPERHYVVTMTAKNAKNEILETRDLRIGQRWRWEPKPEKIGDDRLKPQESREYSFVLPKKSHIVAFEVWHVRLTKENAKFMKDTKGISVEFSNKILQLEHHYPFKTALFQQTFTAQEGSFFKASEPLNFKELIALSKAQQGPIHKSKFPMLFPDGKDLNERKSNSYP